MIFRTINTDAKKLTEQFGLLNKSFRDIKKDFANGLGFKNSLFQTSISKSDLQSLQKFNSAIKVTNDGLTKSQRITKAWNENMTDCSMAAKRMGNDIITGKKNIQDVSNSMKTATVSTKALGVAMNVFANVGFMLAITAITKVVTELAQAQENAVQTAKEATEAYKDEISSIADYKQRLSELHKELNSGNLSYEETKTKRTELMSIQDELIKKFGTEKGAIASVTEAVNGQVDALDNLTEKAYRDWVAKADEQTFWNKLLPGGKSGLDQAIDYMETDQTVSFYDMQNANLSDELQEIQKEIDKTIQSKYNLEKSFATFNVTGRPDEIKEQLDNILQDYMDLSKDVFTEKGVDSSLWDDYRKEVVDSINEAKNEVDKGLKDHQETYKTYIEGLIKYDSEYSDEYANILQKRAELESAQNSGNKEEIQKARHVFMDAINKGIEESGSNENIRKYFESLYPELQSEFSDWAFEFDLKANVKGLNDVANEIGEKYSATDLLDMINTEGTQEGEESFNKLIDKAIEYGVCTDKSAEEVQKLIDLLVELGIVQDNVQGSTSVNETAISSQKTFDEVWNSLGEGDDDAAKKAQEAKEKVLELAEAGKLTIKEFKDSSIADTLKQAGFSAEEATNKVNALVEETKQLSALRTGITSITSAYDEKKESKDNRVSSNTLSSLYDTLDVEKWTDKSDLKVWEQYKDIASDSASSLKQMKEAQDNLATSFVNSNNFLSNLNESNANYYRNLLNEMGVVNGNRVVQNLLGREKAISVIETQNLTNMTGEEINQLINEKGKTEDARIAMREFALEKVYANGQALDTTADIQQLINLIDAFGETSAAIKRYRDYMNGDYNTTAPGGMNVDYLRKEAEKDATSAIKNLKNKQKIKIKTTGSNKADVKRDSGGEKKDSGSKTKKSKQVIDWIERRLKNLQNTIDYTSSKLQNLFTVKSKNSNLDKQIKTTTKLINEYGIAAEKYQQKANKVAKASTKTVKGKKGKKKEVKTKGLSKDVISKIKTGKLTKKTKLSSLIKEYGEDTANKIQSYIDYYDKAQDAKKNAEDQKAKKRELQVQKNQNYVDDYNAKATLAETKAGNAVGYKKKNSYIATQISYLNKSYQKQIAIAKLNEDTTEQARLQAEYEAKKVELQKQQIENLKTEYDNRIGLIDNSQQDANNQLSQMEARGQIIKSSYYSSLNNYENQKLSQLNSELSKLQAQQNTFTKYSQEWYDLQSDIQSVKNAINDAETAIIENNKKVGELRQAMYDDIASRNSNIGTEASFLAGLLGDNLTDDKTGNFTKEGLAMLGTYAIDMESNTSTALSYKKDREELEKQIADYKNGNSHALDAYGSLDAAKKALDEIIQKQQDAISAEYANEKQIYDLMTQRYETQLSYMQSIIDAKKKLLDMEKDIYDYEKNISNQTKSIASLEKQLTALQGDDSEAGRLRRSQLQQSLDEANQELQDTEFDRLISNQQNMLDNLYSQYEDLIHELEKNFEKVVKEGVELINTKSGEISNAITDYATNYGYNPSNDMKSILGALVSSGDGDVTTLPGAINNGFSNLGMIFQKGVTDIVNAYNGSKSNNNNSNNGSSEQQNKNSTADYQEWQRIAGTLGGTTQKLPENYANQILNGIKSGQSNTTKVETTAERNKKIQSAISYINSHLSPGKKKKYKDVNQVFYSKWGKKVLSDSELKDLANIVGVTYDNASKTGNLYKRLKDLGIAGFKRGGIGQLVKASGEDGLALVRNGEGFIAPEHVEAIKDLVNIVPDMTQFTKTLTNIKPVNRNIGNTFGDIVINAELPNVKDSYDFIDDIKNNRKTQQALTIATKDVIEKGKITNNIQSIM